MKVCLVGKNFLDFNDDAGAPVKGMNLFYYGPKDEVEGYFAGKIWVSSTSAMYGKASRIDTSQPIMVDVIYDIQPGKKMTLVLRDIEILNAGSFEELAILSA